MGDRIDNTLQKVGSGAKTVAKKATQPMLTPIHVFIIVVSIAFYVYMETDIFDDVGDTVKIAIYIVFQLLGIFAGLKWGTFTEFVRKGVEILKDEKLTPWEKILKFTQLIAGLAMQAGEAWELLMGEQFKIEAGNGNVNGAGEVKEPEKV